MNYISIASGIISVIVSVLTLFGVNFSVKKIAEYPYGDYLNFSKRRLINTCHIIWIIAFIIEFLYCLIISIFVVFNLLDYKVQLLVFLNLLIIGVIKDYFYNVIQFKPSFKSYIDNNITTKSMIEALVEIELTVQFLLLLLFSILKIDNVFAIITVIVMSSMDVLFLISRVIYNAAVIYYMYEVEELIVKTNDGTIYNHINEFEEKRNMIQVVTNDKRCLSINTSNIVYIEKIKSKESIYEKVKLITEGHSNKDNNDC